MNQLISIIIPTFNRGDFILRAINSVLAQSYKEYELIIVDDGSTDNTRDLLTPYIMSKQIKYIGQENLGVSAARNLGVFHSTGELISFLDSDDEWLPHKLQDQINYLNNFPEVRIAYSEEIWIRNGVRVNQKSSHKKYGGMIFSYCLEQCFIAPSSVILQKSLFTEMSGFDESYQVCEDYDLWLKISSLYEIGLICSPLIIKHGGHPDQLSSKYVAMDLWRLKSMARILKLRELEASEKLKVKEIMERRGLILMKGYLKHNNLEGHQTVERILSELVSL